MAHYAVAVALSLRAEMVHNLGRESSMDAAIEAYERVLAMDPRFTWALSELGDAYRFEAELEQNRGRDASMWVESAIQRFEQAIAIDPGFALPVSGRLKVLAGHIESRIERGQDAEAPLAALFAAVDEIEKTSLGPGLAAFWKARSRRLRAQHDGAWGRDPRASLAAAMGAIRAFAGDSPEDYWLLAEMARCHLLEATYALAAGLDPQPALARAQDAARRARDKGATVEVLSARIELAAARAAEKDGEPRQAGLDTALAHLAPLLENPRFDPEPFALCAEIYARRAELRARRRESPDDDIQGGLAMADRALALNPTMAKAFLAKGYLHLARARATRGADVRAEAGRRAREAFDAAFRNNALLAREHVDASKVLAALRP
jgi:tetratricopeptide (TPR) repeat protein